VEESPFKDQTKYQLLISTTANNNKNIKTRKGGDLNKNKMERDVVGPDHFIRVIEEATGGRTAAQKRADAREKERRDSEARLLEQETVVGPLRGIPADLYSTRALPGATPRKGDVQSENQVGRDKLRDTYKYWKVLDPTSALEPAASGPTEEQLRLWAEALTKYVTINFRKPLKQIIKTRMYKYMVEDRNGVTGIRFKQTKAPPTNFNGLKKYLKEELLGLPIGERQELVQRLFFIMYVMFRSQHNGWMIQECNSIMEKRRLRCKCPKIENKKIHK
jgi:hypothetical protein